MRLNFGPGAVLRVYIAGCQRGGVLSKWAGIDVLIDGEDVLWV
jgi:hypothetical protein